MKIIPLNLMWARLSVMYRFYNVWLSQYSICFKHNFSFIICLKNKQIGYFSGGKSPGFNQTVQMCSYNFVRLENIKRKGSTFNLTADLHFGLLGWHMVLCLIPALIKWSIVVYNRAYNLSKSTSVACFVLIEHVIT